MKVSDYIVRYLISRGITDVFGYPGGMVTHLMDSFRKYRGEIAAHVTYHEQGAAFAACGYAQISGRPGVAYATSGPGATNLITGICNAYFDSIPVIFITGQVNTYEAKGNLGVRQKGFQETDIVSMVKSVTKYAEYVGAPDRIRYCLDRAFEEACSGRKGPVLLDIPMNVFRGEIDADQLAGYEPPRVRMSDKEEVLASLNAAFAEASRPCLLFGNGIKISGNRVQAREAAARLGIPVVSSMVAVDIAAGLSNYFGFVGAYGHREANFIVAKSDLVVCIGSRLDVRQVGGKRENFAPDARIVRFDVDPGELSDPVHSDELQFLMDAGDVLRLFREEVRIEKDYPAWLGVCGKLREELGGRDERLPNLYMRELSKYIPSGAPVTTDVGQNQVWAAQSLTLRAGQEVLFSGGHGAMGYSLPAAIGACMAKGSRPVVCFSGDGGFQMNIQELQFIAREDLPVKIVVFNNRALGMIRHFQEMYFDGEYFQTREDGGYLSPDFVRISEGYGIRAIRIRELKELENTEALGSMMSDERPLLVEIMINEDTYVFPKLEFGKPNQDQEPLLDRALYQYLMELSE